MKNSCRFFANKDCQFYPCHQGIDEINCLFCYCPLYFLPDCPGTYHYKDKDGAKIKVCTDCTWPHEAQHYDRMMEILRTQIRAPENTDRMV